MPKKKIIWLASYPKSGNTWVRIFLANYLNTSNTAISINNINSAIISSSRQLFDKSSAVLSSNLTHDEIDNLRPKFYEELSDEINHVQFIKTHDAHTYNTNHKPIFPQSATFGVIHIVRNPADVAVSFANHLNTTYSKSIKNLNNPNYQLSAKTKGLNKQLRQILLDWSMHYESWKTSGHNYLLVRYEDMIQQPEHEFKRIVEFSGLKYQHKKLLKAIENSSFHKLKEEENNSTFRERPMKSKIFFRKGQVDNWKNELSIEQIKTLAQKHTKIIKELKYQSLLEFIE